MWRDKYLYIRAVVGFFALIVGSSATWAGMDFTNLGGNKAMVTPNISSDVFYMHFELPWFKSKQEAIDWANT